MIKRKSAAAQAEDTLGSPRSESDQLVITWFAGSWALGLFPLRNVFEFFTSKGKASELSEY